MTELQDSPDCEIGSNEISTESNGSPFIANAIRAVGSVAFLSVLCLAVLQYSSKTYVPAVTYPELGEKIQSRHLEDTDDTFIGSMYASASYLTKPGAADLATTINMFRSSKGPLTFTISSVKSSSGKYNPLNTAATARNVNWGSQLKTPSTSDFVTSSTVGTITTTSAITTAFKNAGINPPTTYKEYTYYGEYCSTHLFLIMKNGPSSSSNPGYGIQNDLLSTAWTNIAISVGQNPVDMSAAGTNGLGNAYWTIMFSSSYTWTPVTKKPTRQPTKKPA